MKSKPIKTSCDPDQFRTFDGAIAYTNDGSVAQFDLAGKTWETSQHAGIGGPEWFNDEDWVIVRTAIIGTITEVGTGAPFQEQETEKLADIYYAHYCFVDDTDGTNATVFPEGAAKPFNLAIADPCDCVARHPSTDWVRQEWTWILLGSNADIDLGGTYRWVQGGKWPLNAGSAEPGTWVKKRLKIVSGPRPPGSVTGQETRHTVQLSDAHPGPIQWGPVVEMSLTNNPDVVLHARSHGATLDADEAQLAWMRSGFPRVRQFIWKK